MNDKKIAEQVEKTIKRIRANEHTPDALIRIYKNVAKSKDLTDDQRQALVDEIEAHLWKFAPPKAKKVFGPLNRSTRQTLETYLQYLLTRYDLTNNRHKNKVKTKNPKKLVAGFFCGTSRNRTRDTRIFSPLLYQLS